MLSDVLSDSTGDIVSGLALYRDYVGGPMYPRKEIEKALSLLIYLRISGDTFGLINYTEQQMRRMARREARMLCNEALAP